MIICKRKSDGRIIESQGSDTALEAITSNIQASGYNLSEVDIEVIEDDQGHQLINQQILNDQTYKNKRQLEYPSIGDQLDSILKYLVTIPNIPSELGTIITEWQNIKTKYPKP